MHDGHHEQDDTGACERIDELFFMLAVAQAH